MGSRIRPPPCLKEASTRKVGNAVEGRVGIKGDGGVAVVLLILVLEIGGDDGLRGWGVWDGGIAATMGG